MAFVLDCSVTMAWLFPDEAAEATDRLRDSLPEARVWGAVLELANRHGLSVYGAMYLELAVRMRLPLVTLDRALAAAGTSRWG